MLACFKKHQRSQKSQLSNTVGTIVHYTSDGLSQAIMVEGGPGGSIVLSDEEYLAITKEVDKDIYVGASSAQLTGKQILESPAFQEILKDRERSPLQSPRATAKATKRK